MIISKEQAKEMFQYTAQDELRLEDMNQKREELRARAMKCLYDNQECFVAQWILQNPFANPSDYRLKFVYNDQSLLGYSVTMEKIENV
jgi:hypothetical protein